MGHAPFLFCLLLALALPSAASALSMGALEILSKPGEPFRAKSSLLLEAQEKVQSLALGSADDYALVNLTRPAIVNQITAQIKQEQGNPVVWLQSDVALRGETLFILLHITSNQRTYLPFFRLSSSASVSETPPTTPAKQVADEKETRTTPAVAPKKEPKAAPPKQTTYGPVRHGETLTSVARRVARSNSVSDWQVQVAIWQRNPDAFTMNNMNGLKEKNILEIPSPDEMAQVDPKEAERVREEHIAAWQKMEPVARRIAPQMASTPPSITTTVTKPPKPFVATVEPDQPRPQQPGPVPSPPQPRMDLEPLNRISAQLQTIQGQLEKNQGQFDRLIDRVSTLEESQRRFDTLQNRLSVLEERLNKK